MWLSKNREPVTDGDLGNRSSREFPSAVEQASGLHPPLPARMSDLYDRTERVTRIENDLYALEALIKERIAS